MPEICNLIDRNVVHVSYIFICYSVLVCYRGNVKGIPEKLDSGRMIWTHGRLDFGRMDAGRLDFVRLDSERLDSGGLDAWTPRVNLYGHHGHVYSIDTLTLFFIITSNYLGPFRSSCPELSIFKHFCRKYWLQSPCFGQITDQLFRVAIIY